MVHGADLPNFIDKLCKINLGRIINLCIADRDANQPTKRSNDPTFQEYQVFSQMVCRWWRYMYWERVRVWLTSLFPQEHSDTQSTASHTHSSSPHPTAALSFSQTPWYFLGFFGIEVSFWAKKCAAFISLSYGGGQGPLKGHIYRILPNKWASWINAPPTFDFGYISETTQ